MSMNEWQCNKIKKLLCNVQNKVSFYEEILEGKSIQDLNCSEVKDVFYKIPIVNKKIIRSQLKEFIDRDIKTEDINEVFSMDKDHKKEYHYTIAGKSIITEFTTGSSGMPFISLKTNYERVKLGKSLWEKRKQFSPVNPKNMFKFIHNDGFVYPFPFEKKEDKEQRLVEELNYLANSKFQWWHINTYKLEEYVRILNKNNIKMQNLEVIENNGSYISDTEIKKYMEIFQCKIANNYGCREVWNIAYTCEHNHLHVNEDAIFFEIIDEMGNVIQEPNVAGDVVVTSYNQCTMPFIRYRVGDKAMYVLKECNNTTKQIALLPERVQIAGTNINGNSVFGQVILELSLWHNIHSFDKIAVIQIELCKFIVNIQGLVENKDYFEQRFYRISQYIFKHNRYFYEFRYVENIETKSLFCVKLL